MYADQIFGIKDSTLFCERICVPFSRNTFVKVATTCSSMGRSVLEPCRLDKQMGAGDNTTQRSLIFAVDFNVSSMSETPASVSAPDQPNAIKLIKFNCNNVMRMNLKVAI